MRYLNKIVFINSAHVHYKEIELDGNVHFIGTQGVGKSTLLRAILFFYNAEKGGLGISKEQKRFDEFYLPNQDSYIIYEVQREQGKFFVVMHKSAGRINYRFVDCAYDKSYFVDDGGHVHHEWGKISQAIGRKVAHSRIVDTGREYRDIIYGNTQVLPKELRRYNILESSNYQNVYRTIQNIFLNQSLESRVIKDTIIASMNLATNGIELSFYRSKAKEFRQKYEDTWKWFCKDKNGHIKVVVDANRVDIRHAEYLMTVQRIEQLAAQLDYACRRDKDLLPVLGTKEKDARAELKRQERLLGEEQDKYQTETAKHNRTIGEIDAKLNKTRERRNHWAQSDIDHIRHMVERKDTIGIEHRMACEEYAKLTDSSTDITEKYKHLRADEEQKLKQLINTLTERELKLEQAFADKKNALTSQLLEQTKRLRIRYEAEAKQLQEKHDVAFAQKSELEKMLLKVAGDNPYLAKQQELDEQLHSIDTRRHELEKRVSTLLGDIKLVGAEAEAKIKQIEQEYEKDIMLMSRKQEQLQEDMNNAEAMLQRQEKALVGWLGNNVKGWESSLGKVLDEENVLYNTNLSPQLSDDNVASIMGVTLDLSQIDRTVRTPQQLQMECESLLNALTELKQQRAHRLQRLTEAKELAAKKPNTQLRQLRAELQQIEAEQNILPNQVDKVNSELLQLKAELELWRKEQRENIEKERIAVTASLSDIEKRQKALGDKLTREEHDRERNMRKGIAQEEELMNKALSDIAEQKQAHTSRYEQKSRTLDEQMDKELQGKGLDPLTLKTLRERIEKLAADLNYIEQHQKDYFVWQRDTEELFDKEEENKARLREVKQVLDALHQRFEERKKKRTAAIDQQRHTCYELAEQQNRIAEALASVDRFVQANEDQLPQDIKGTKTTEKTDDILEELRQNVSNRQSRMDSFKQGVNIFKSNFSAQNTFGFPTEFNTDADYEEFAANLHEFIAMRKMDDYRNRTSELYADITQRLAREVNDLMANVGQVKKIIGEINRDFHEDNFAGVIKDIQLRAEESNDRLMQHLLKVSQFVEDAQFSMGEVNLFSDERQRAANNAKALQLVMTLIELLDVDLRRDTVSLADTFKLEFKVRENDNDTSWVEKLSNVGSDGTDILVKAMVNIMLINVFKRKVAKKSADFKLHCMMDEIGKLHPNNVQGILSFANKRNILLINSSPTTYNASAYKYTYMLSKDADSYTDIKQLLTIK